MKINIPLSGAAKAERTNTKMSKRANILVCKDCILKTVLAFMLKTVVKLLLKIDEGNVDQIYNL